MRLKELGVDAAVRGADRPRGERKRRPQAVGHGAARLASRSPQKKALAPKTQNPKP